MNEEIWKDIDGYEGSYMISNMGIVKSLNYNRTGEEKILKPWKQKSGYLQVILCKNNKQKSFLVHKLVACAFIPNYENKPQIDHINAIKDDNRVDNLRWCTAKENSNNVLTISKLSGPNNYKARKVLQFTKEGVFVREWECIMDIQRELGFNQSNISYCCSGKRKIAYGYKWEYV